jgi:hypothetical protein
MTSKKIKKIKWLPQKNERRHQEEERNRGQHKKSGKRLQLTNTTNN